MVARTPTNTPPSGASSRNDMPCRVTIHPADSSAIAVDQFFQPAHRAIVVAQCFPGRHPGQDGGQARLVVVFVEAKQVDQSEMGQSIPQYRIVCCGGGAGMVEYFLTEPLLHQIR